RAIGNKYCLIGSFGAANTRVVRTAKSEYTACTRGYRRRQCIRQVAPAYQCQVVCDRKIGISSRNRIVNVVSKSTVHARHLYRKAGKGNVEQRRHWLQEMHGSSKTKLLLQLLFTGFKIAPVTFAAHVVNTFPATANYGAYFSGESAEDSFVNGSHKN